MSKNKTVLVISDGHEQFTLVASLLRNDGYRVLFESDLSQGLKIAKAEPPNLIISELAVPNVDGLQLCCRVREDRRLGATPILLVGDLSKQSAIVADGLRCGAADYLQKPIDQFKLFDLCRGVAGLETPNPSFDRSENLFNSLIENISDAITIIDAAGTVLFESPSTKRIFGYEPGELLGKGFFDLVHTADVNEVVEYFNSVHWGAGISPPLDYRFRQKDGSWKLVESTGSPINDPRFGSGVVVTSHEMTIKKFSLDSALKNDILRTALFDNAATGLALFSPSGRLVEGNPALLRMLDYSEKDLCGMLLAEFIFSEDVENDKLALVDLISGKRPHYQFENGYLTPGGERIWGRLTIVAISGQNERSQFLVGIFEDPVGQKALPVQNKDTPLTNFNRWKIDNVLISKN